MSTFNTKSIVQEMMDLVKLLFEQVKESNKDNTKVIDELSITMVELIKIANKVDEKLKRLFWLVGIAMAIFGVSTTIVVAVVTLMK